VDSLLAPILDAGWARGVVVGVIDPSGSEIFGYGQASDDGGVPGGDTLFEIGSITKTFTNLWMATLVDAGIVNLHDDVQSYLPGQDKVPTYQGQAIELWELSTHTSGLVRDVTNYHPTDPLDPQGNYSVSDLFSFLAGTQLQTAPGTVFSYSNVGVGLLGYALSLKAGLSWQSAIQGVIAGPLGLKDTAELLTPDQQARFAQPHDAELNVVHPYTFTPALEAAGALRSTASDLLTLASAELGLTTSSLAPAMALTQQVYYPQIAEGLCLGLFFTPPGTFEHDGATGGFTSYFSFDTTRRRGVVVLVNTSFLFTGSLAGELGTLAPGDEPLSVVPPTLTPSATEIGDYVGSYNFGPGVSLAITQQGDQLFAQLSGQLAYRLYESERDLFYLRVVYAQLVFARDDSGTVTAVTLDQNGNQQVGIKE
jgi:CubicO group peptidase (beta-lactamase class C family)